MQRVGAMERSRWIREIVALPFLLSSDTDVFRLFTIMERVGAPPETIPALLLSLGEAFHEAGNWEEALTWSML